MKILKEPWFIPIILSIVILAGGGFYISNIVLDKKILPEYVVQAQLEKMYGGTVQSLRNKNDRYEAEIIKDKSVYKVEVNDVTGVVQSLIQTGEYNEMTPALISEAELREMIAKKYTGTLERIALDTKQEPPIYKVEISNEQVLKKVNVDAVTGEIISEKEKETTSNQAVITKKQAIDIARRQLEGKVEYVSYEKTSDGGYYLVEIEGHDEEAIFQIHAISGEILSVTWDD